MPVVNPSARMPMTAWSCIQAVKDPAHPQFQAAVARLATHYWKPIFHYLRVLGHPVQTAENLTQEFFLRLLDKNRLLTLADKQRGRFRDYLQKVLKKFAYDLTVRPNVQVQFEECVVAFSTLIQDSDRRYEPPAQQTPEDAFCAQWQADVPAAARRSLLDYYKGLRKAAEWQRYQIFAAYHFVASAANQPTHQALAVQFGVTEDQVRYALKVVLQRYERLVLQENRDQTGSEEDLEPCS